MAKKVSESQKNAVHFCEKMLGIKYKYSLENYAAVSRFLDKNLKKASEKYESGKENKRRRLMNFYERFGDILDKGRNRRG